MSNQPTTPKPLDYRELLKHDFDRDTRGHSLSILHDDGLYRHLVMKQPHSSHYWYEIITAPGSLTIRGDMGGFIFARLKDMFEFFRADPKEQFRDEINPGYWYEKLQCDPQRVKKFSLDALRSSVLEYVAEIKEEMSEKDYAELTKLIKIGLSGDMSQQDAMEELADFEFTYENGDTLSFGEYYDFHSWEWDRNFLWNLHAIVAAIRAYDECIAKLRPRLFWQPAVQGSQEYEAALFANASGREYAIREYPHSLSNPASVFLVTVSQGSASKFLIGETLSFSQAKQMAEHHFADELRKEEEAHNAAQASASRLVWHEFTNRAPSEGRTLMTTTDRGSYIIQQSTAGASCFSCYHCEVTKTDLVEMKHRVYIGEGTDFEKARLIAEAHYEEQLTKTPEAKPSDEAPPALSWVHDSLNFLTKAVAEGSRGTYSVEFWEGFRENGEGLRFKVSVQPRNMRGYVTIGYADSMEAGKELAEAHAAGKEAKK